MCVVCVEHASCNSVCYQRCQPFLLQARVFARDERTLVIRKSAFFCV